MDAQLKRGMLDILVLASLSHGDSYGYLIIKQMSRAIEVTESTLYPILKRLETGGLVESYTVEYNGRLRKYYKITFAGKQKIAEYVEDWKEAVKIYNYIVETAEEPHFPAPPREGAQE